VSLHCINMRVIEWNSNDVIIFIWLKYMLLLFCINLYVCQNGVSNVSANLETCFLLVQLLSATVSARLLSIRVNVACHFIHTTQMLSLWTAVHNPANSSIGDPRLRPCAVCLSSREFLCICHLLWHVLLLTAAKSTHLSTWQTKPQSYRLT